MAEDHITSLLKESRQFSPSAEFAARAHVSSMARYEEIYAHAVRDPDGYWAEVARELRWTKPFTKVLEWEAPFCKWFSDGRLNVSDNCLDRHLEGPRRNKAALIWEGEPGDVRTLTYLQLHREVCRFANALKRLGVCKGDRVCLYMPMIPELAISMLACARLGATHSIVFGGFSADALRDRILDADAKLVVTADGGHRRGGVVALKDAVDEAITQCPAVQRVVVVRRTGSKVAWKEGRDLWWDEALSGVSADCPAEPVDAEHPLFILYTSGTTGRPKGVVHSTGGYLTQVASTTRMVFDLGDEDVFWCTADIGWVTGHSYVVYGPLANGATSLMYEGAPNFPGLDRFWDIIERHRVSIFYTAPTAIRTFIRWGEEHPTKHDLSSLRLLGTVGEPINPEAWMWYHANIGGGRCPVVDTWWQTETGAILISPLPGATPTKPGSATRPLPGIVPAVVDKEGRPQPPDKGGFLVIERPWPAMLRTIYRDPDRYRAQYFSQIEGKYFTGDGARRDTDGYYWLMGRIDDVLNVSGHRLGTAEVESALVSHDLVAEAAVVGRPDEITGQAVVAFVTLTSGTIPSDEVKHDLTEHVAAQIGKFARPAAIRFADALPKTRSGKIMRRLLKEIAGGSSAQGDTTTLEDISVLAKLREDEE
ncbi:MAG: acetate--CoA ligase [Deltaproteobacteria bacterium]|nr:acetate--CoA ligase [Deltaproteobacteria bacterium]